MPKIQRKTQKIFCNSADSDQIAVFGSMSTGTPVYSNDVEQLQSNEAYEIGWDAATLEDKAPFMEEMNGVQYGLTYQLAYNFQEGISEYDAGTDYYIGSIVKVLEDGKPVLYSSLTDNNIGNNPITDATNWERLSFGGGGLEIGDIGFTQMAIDESKGKRRALNRADNIIIQEQWVKLTKRIKNTRELFPDRFCTEAEWQAELSASPNGVCYKYVIDDEAGTIRLPKYPEYLDLSINAAAKSQTVSVYGTGKSLGMYNGSQNFGLSASGNAQYANTGGYNKTVGADVSGTHVTASKAWGVVKNASTSGLTGNVTVPAVESEKIKGTYFIQVATGAETEDNIINEIELNNPYSFGDSKYSPKPLNNLSWLKSEGQYNPKGTYPPYYDWALVNANNGVEGFKFITDTYTDYDFVLNTAEETFRLPLLNGSELKTGVKSADIPIQQSGNTYIAPANGWFVVEGVASGSSAYVDLVGNVSSSSHCQTSGHYLKSYIPVSRGSSCILYYTDLSQISLRFIYAQGNGSLYFYVGETVQNANLVNIGRIQETYTTKSMVDGRWVATDYGIVSNTGLAANTSATFDLSNYLPNDGYNYEVLFSLQAQTGATSGYEVNLSLGTDIAPGFIITKGVTRASARISCVGTATVPVGRARQVIIKQWSTYPCDIILLAAVCYRRIGTNL